MPNVEERERIWQVQLHSRKTPLAADVDFRALAEAYARSGGDIKNAVLKAAQIATTEPGPDAQKRIHQRHFVQGMEEVIAAENVMSQSLFESAAAAGAGGRSAGADGRRPGAAPGGAGAGGRAAGCVERGQTAAGTESERRQAELLALVKAPQPRGPWITAIAALAIAAAALLVALVR